MFDTGVARKFAKALPARYRLRQDCLEGVCDHSKRGVGQVPLLGTYLHLPLDHRAVLARRFDGG